VFERLWLLVARVVHFRTAPIFAGSLARTSRLSYSLVMKLLNRWRTRALPEPAVAEAEVATRRSEPEPTEAELIRVELPEPTPNTFDPLALNAQGLAQPWCPQPNETAQEYAAFQAWLLADTVCPKFGPAVRFAWEQRKVATRALGADVVLASPEAFQRISAQCVQLALQWSFNELSKHLAASASAAHPGATMKETTSIVKDMATLARLLQGLSTENVSVRDGTEANYELLSDDELVQLMQLEAKAKGQAQ
jgi:hypothetical protein